MGGFRRRGRLRRWARVEFRIEHDAVTVLIRLHLGEVLYKKCAASRKVERGFSLSRVQDRFIGLQLMMLALGMPSGTRPAADSRSPSIFFGRLRRQSRAQGLLWAEGLRLMQQHLRN